jgi:hypothetical protein
MCGRWHLQLALSGQHQHQQQGMMHRALVHGAQGVPASIGQALMAAVEGLAGNVLRHPPPALVLYPPAPAIATEFRPSSYSTAASVQPETQSQPTPTQGQAGLQHSPQQVPVFSTAQIREIRASIFGEPIKRGSRDGRRVLARRLKGPELASWYFMPPTMPGAHNEEAE